MPRRTSRRRTSFRVRANSRSRGARKYGALFRSALRKATRVTSRAAKSSRRMLRKLSRRVRPNSRRRSSRHGLSPNYAALVRAGAQGAVRLAQSPAVRKAVTAAAPYAIEVAKTGATALQTKLQAKLHRWGAKEAAPVAANRRRSSRRR